MQSSHDSQSVIMVFVQVVYPAGSYSFLFLISMYLFNLFELLSSASSREEP